MNLTFNDIQDEYIEERNIISIQSAKEVKVIIQLHHFDTTSKVIIQLHRLESHLLFDNQIFAINSLRSFATTVEVSESISVFGLNSTISAPTIIPGIECIASMSCLVVSPPGSR